MTKKLKSEASMKQVESAMRGVSESKSRNQRILDLHKCITPEQVAAFIWTPELEELMGDRSMYRNPFAEWIRAYRAGKPSKELFSYKTPLEVANAVWPAELNDPDGLFEDFRQELVVWIELYKHSDVDGDGSMNK